MRLAIAAPLLIVLIISAGLAGDRQLAEEKNWLDTTTFPAFVRPQTLEVNDQDDALAKLHCGTTLRVVNRDAERRATMLQKKHRLRR